MWIRLVRSSLPVWWTKRDSVQGNNWGSLLKFHPKTALPCSDPHPGLVLSHLPLVPLLTVETVEPEMFTWKTKGNMTPPGQPVEKDRNLAELLGIAGSLNLRALSVSESPASWLPGLLRTTSPGPWNNREFLVPGNNQHELSWRPHLGSKTLLHPTACKFQCWVPQVKQPARQGHSATHRLPKVILSSQTPWNTSLEIRPSPPEGQNSALPTRVQVPVSPTRSSHIPEPTSPTRDRHLERNYNPAACGKKTAKHNKLDKMRQQRNMLQMKE